MREIRIHDTLSGELRPLEPRDPGRVAVYACGPTVYAPIHVGNARPFVVFSLFKRFLEHEGYETTFVANVTDVNDKIYDAARREGVASDELARRMVARYEEDTSALLLGRPDREPKATETIAAIVDLIQALIDSDHAYVAGGDVYFRVRSFPAYGRLSNRPLDEMSQGEGDDSAAIKESPQDFALWKAQKEGEDTAWEAPWGRGRPGWHIECSAMAEQILGLDFDVHGGGSDLIFPHHENEIAQTEAARGRPLARIWMHNGMLRMSEEKMSKSVGNVTLLSEAIEIAGRDALVMYFAGGHYRQPIAFGEEALREAGRAAERVRELARRLDPAAPEPEALAPYVERFFAALADDFNTPAARAELFEWVSEANRRLDAGETLGVGRLREMLWVLGLEGLLEAREEQVDPEA
ncbi:MAG TPA: cysteine--tRNA ligase, partial [Longimicrobiales bacterium]|nr:cysteine--tRNA ligase [Longimicrobiales bacterium]